MRQIVAPLGEHRALLLPLAWALLFTYGYFVDAPAWNQNSRLALTRALVESRAVAIDAYHPTTGDKSKRGPHFYSDKAPGVSLVATIPYAALYAVRRATGGELPEVRVIPLDPREAEAGHAPQPEDRQPGDRLVYNFAHRLALYLCGLFAVAVPSVIGVAAVWLLAYRQSRGEQRAATVAALCYGLATPIFPYATAFYGHGLCAAALIAAFAVVVLLGATTNRRPGLWAGALLGLAVATEYPAAVPTVMVMVLALWLQSRRFVLDVVLGGLPWVLVLAAYHTVAFGHPLKTGYDFVYLPEFAEGMAVNYGIGPPQLEVLYAIVFGSYRGLLYLSPVLFVAVWGLAVASRDASATLRRAALVAAAICGFYLLLNAGYYMWDGGASFGPRHTIPMLGFLALGLVPAYRVVPRALLVLAAVSVAAMLLGAAANPEAPQFGNPLWEFSWGRLLGGTTGATVGATNLGRLLGLPGALSLAPLAVLWWWAWPPRTSATRSDR
ncbi:MAG: hypothetical protein JKY37_07420 [Nannocystaceae bacterium]|nr:hypothetical protein [Nannocystaceae bacterium]